MLIKVTAPNSLVEPKAVRALGLRKLGQFSQHPGSRPNANFILLQGINGTQIPSPSSSAHQIRQDAHRRPLPAPSPRSEARTAEPMGTLCTWNTSCPCFINWGLWGKGWWEKRKDSTIKRGKKVGKKANTYRWNQFFRSISICKSSDYIIKNAKAQSSGSSHTRALKRFAKNTQIFEQPFLFKMIPTFRVLSAGYPFKSMRKRFCYPQSKKSYVLVLEFNSQKRGQGEEGIQ